MIDRTLHWLVERWHWADRADTWLIVRWQSYRRWRVRMDVAEVKRLATALQTARAELQGLEVENARLRAQTRGPKHG